MTRRELQDAVIEAARIALKEHFSRFGMASTAAGTIALKESVYALDACTEPDLTALNARVAEAVEEYRDRMRKNRPGLNDAWEVTNQALDARRDAMKPKPRYEVEPNSTVPVRMTIYDRQDKRPLTPPEVAALLNAEDKP